MSQAKWQREAGIFGSFLDAAPDFAGELITQWKHNENDSPDIVCTDRLGNRIGVEMTEWLHDQQICDFSRWERVFWTVNFASDWTVDVYLDPFSQDCEPRERQDIATQLTKIVGEEVSQPKAWESGSFPSP